MELDVEFLEKGEPLTQFEDVFALLADSLNALSFCICELWTGAPDEFLNCLNFEIGEKMLVGIRLKEICEFVLWNQVSCVFYECIFDDFAFISVHSLEERSPLGNDVIREAIVGEFVIFGRIEKRQLIPDIIKCFSDGLVAHVSAPRIIERVAFEFIKNVATFQASIILDVELRNSDFVRADSARSSVIFTNPFLEVCVMKKFVTEGDQCSFTVVLSIEIVSTRLTNYVVFSNLFQHLLYGSPNVGVFPIFSHAGRNLLYQFICIHFFHQSFLCDYYNSHSTYKCIVNSRYINR